MENRCVSCGTIIPEGQQVCKHCLEKKPEKSCDMPRHIANVYDNLEIVASKHCWGSGIRLLARYMSKKEGA